MIELFAGLSGWGEGAVAEGYRVVSFDLFDMPKTIGAPRPDGDIQLVLQDVLTLHGRQFKDADLIVASPPCPEFSYMAMPWTRAKQIERALLGDGEFPDDYKGSRTKAELTALFGACFRIQREASAAAGRHIPMVVENVRGAQKWVGRARGRFGSFFLWGDVPALMPKPQKAIKNEGGSWFAVSHNKVPHSRGDGIKNARGWWSDGANALSATKSSKSPARKAASALIARIPFELARHVAATYKPCSPT